MLSKSLYVLTVLVLAVAMVGCGGSTATPTKSAPLPAPTQVIVVVTATLPPATATTSATATLMPTTAVTPTLETTPVKPTNTPGKPRPTATKKAPTATPTQTVPAANKYPAPKLISPMYVQGGPKDERHFPGDALIFQWASVGGLQGDECYQLSVNFVPGGGDSFLVDCADQTPPPKPVSFTLNKPSGPGPNYSSYLPYPISDVTVNWTVTVVKDAGKASTGAQASDGTRHKTIPLSPTSARAQFPLKGS
ncbi:MAG: hypothetical protein M1132_07295 [Chloroflexi bacterium]|nr:hypothetical protein [Chloroflexota bacterium]